MMKALQGILEAVIEVMGGAERSAPLSVMMEDAGLTERLRVRRVPSLPLTIQQDLWCASGSAAGGRSYAVARAPLLAEVRPATCLLSPPLQRRFSKQDGSPHLALRRSGGGCLPQRVRVR